MKKTYSFILLFLATVAGIAQTSNLKGKVTDQQTQSVIPFASVAIHKSGSDIPLDGTTTTNEGLFEIKKVKSGNYDIVFSFIGYEKKVINNVSVNEDKIKYVFSHSNPHFTRSSDLYKCGKQSVDAEARMPYSRRPLVLPAQ